MEWMWWSNVRLIQCCLPIFFAVCYSCRWIECSIELISSELNERHRFNGLQTKREKKKRERAEKKSWIYIWIYSYLSAFFCCCCFHFRSENAIVFSFSTKKKKRVKCLSSVLFFWIFSFFRGRWVNSFSFFIFISSVAVATATTTSAATWVFLNNLGGNC